MAAKILIVDDEDLICSLLARRLSLEGFEVQTTTEPERGLGLLKKSRFDVMVTDLRMGRLDGLELLMRARKIQPDCEVVVMTGFATVESARQALTQGASDYITKPLDIENELVPLLVNLTQDEKLDAPSGDLQCSRQPATGDRFVGSGTESQRLLKRVAKVSKANISVLLEGESGTGKERIAALLHEGSQRKGGPFVKLNCAALPETLLESELFGHVKGAFTGATSNREGLFEAAHGGTLLLDEIGEISRPFQAKLLRILQDGEFYRLGDAKKTVRVDVRVIAATNRNLLEAVRRGDFREDLYYRLNVVPLQISPLRDRSDDLSDLIAYFAERAASRHARNSPLQVTPEVLDVLTRYSWPGNVRELENAIESATVMAESNVLLLEDLPVAIQQFAGQGKPASEFSEGLGRRGQEATLEDIEMRCILQAMIKTGFNRTRAANLLGVTRRTLSYRIGKYELESDLVRLQGDSSAMGGEPEPFRARGACVG